MSSQGSFEQKLKALEALSACDVWHLIQQLAASIYLQISDNQILGLRCIGEITKSVQRHTNTSWPTGRHQYALFDLGFACNETDLFLKKNQVQYHPSLAGNQTDQR